MLADVGQAMTEIEPRAALQRLAEVLVESPQGPVTWCAVLEVDEEVEVSAAAGVELRRPERFRSGFNTGPARCRCRGPAARPAVAGAPLPGRARPGARRLRRGHARRGGSPSSS